MAKKKGGRYTPPKQEAMCKPRSGHAGKLLPHNFKSRKRTRQKGAEEWGTWIYTCSWCGKEKP